MKLEKSKKTAKDYYVDPDEMWDELNNFYNQIETSDDPDSEVMSSSLGQMIDDIATKLKYMNKFINYSYREEMTGDARLKMVKAVYDRNFTLWRTAPCTPICVENGREYVVVYNTRKNEWEPNRTYLKIWDVVLDLDDPFEIPDPSWENTEGLDVEHPSVELFWCKDDTGSFVYPNDNHSDTSEVVNTITYKNSPFSYFTKIAYHAFVNRIKKEKRVAEALKNYQEKVYEEMYSSGDGWENVKRQSIDDEENFYYEIEDFFDDSHEDVEVVEDQIDE